jgi:hypothetical protein
VTKAQRFEEPGPVPVLAWMDGVEFDDGTLQQLRHAASLSIVHSRVLRLPRAAREERAPSSQASAWSWASAGIEEQSALMVKAEEPRTQLATRIPKELHRRLRLYCVTHAGRPSAARSADLVLMQFVAAAIEEKLARLRGAPAKRRRGTKG